MKAAYEELTPQYGIQANFAWPTLGDEAKTQLIELRKMLNAGYHAIIINPVNQYNLVPGILEAAYKKIPVLDVGAKTNEKAVETAKPFYVPVKTFDFYQQGVLGANYIIQRLKSVNVGKVAIIEGYKESIQSIHRSKEQQILF